MSEYWKSTPKYWCKHCKTFVRDTKLEKTNHEATPKHQGNIKRFLRDLHRGHEREERDKDRAKNEVERLNGVIAGTSASKDGPQGSRQTAASLSSGPREATPADRKAQLAQLAGMGIAVPEDFRREMAMAGDWQTISQRRIDDRVKNEEGLEDFKDFKPDLTLNVGVRKRRFEGQEEEEEAGATVVRKGWGSTTRRYPGAVGGDEEDLDALLGKVATPNQETSRADETEPSPQPGAATIPCSDGRSSTATHPSIKKEDSDGLDIERPLEQQVVSDISIKEENGALEPAVMFKKRKSKAAAKT